VICIGYRTREPSFAKQAAYPVGSADWHRRGMKTPTCQPIRKTIIREQYSQKRASGDNF
jgi:hypothetical protein